MSNKQFHGKAKRIFINTQSINPHLICTVCFDVFEQPHRLLCGHTFCWVCIQLCVKTQRKNTCPQCRTDFVKRKPEKDLLASKLVDELKTKCIHPGCDWVGINSLLRKHQRNCVHKEKKNCKDLQADNEIVVLDEDAEQQIMEVNQMQYKIEFKNRPNFEDSELIQFYSQLEQSNKAQ